MNEQFEDLLSAERIGKVIDTINGANSSAIIYSIAETAKANNLRPYEYFEHLLTEISKHIDDRELAFIDDIC